MRSFAPVATVLLAALVLPATGTALGLPGGWQHAGTSLHYVGTTTAHAGSAATPLAWLALDARITSVDTHTATFSFQGTDAMGTHTTSVTYDLATRKDVASDDYAFLWVTPADIAAGQAILGNHAYILLTNTPAAVEFSDGQADYYFDPGTGLLLRAENSFDPGAAQLTSVCG